jgi:hypothetical protein
VCVEITQTSHKKKRGKDLPLKLDAQERERERKVKSLNEVSESTHGGGAVPLSTGTDKER